MHSLNTGRQVLHNNVHFCAPQLLVLVISGTFFLPRQAQQLPVKCLRGLLLQSHSLGPLCFYFLFAYSLLLSASSVCTVQVRTVPSAPDV